MLVEMELAILEDRNYEPKKEDFIDKIPETIPEGQCHSHPSIFTLQTSPRILPDECETQRFHMKPS